MARVLDTTDSALRPVVPLSHTPTHNYPTHSATLYEQLVALLGSRSRPHSTMVRIYEISRLISGGTVGSGQPIATGRTEPDHTMVPIGENDQLHHPISENVVPDIENQTESITTSMLNPENIDSSNNPPIATRIATTPHTALNLVPDIENQTESITTNMLNPENIDSSNNPQIATRIATTPHTALNVVPDIENQSESITTSMLNPENIDSSNNPPIATRIATTPHTALLYNYSNPKSATYFVGVYPAFLACVAFFTGAKNSPFVTHKSLMRSSLVAYFMAILVLRILFCLYDHLRRPSNQHFYLRLYKVLTYVYDILWMLAILLVVPALPQH